MNIVIIDNYDSFTYNLSHLLKELGATVSVVRNDQFQLEQLEQLERYAPLALLLLSEAIGEAARHLRELVGSPSAETRRRWDSPFSSRVGFMVSCFIT